MTEWQTEVLPAGRCCAATVPSACHSRSPRSLPGSSAASVRLQLESCCFCLCCLFVFFFQLISFYPPESSDNRQNFCGWTDAARRLHLSHYWGSCVRSHETPPPPQTGPPPPSLLSSDFRRWKKEQQQRSGGASGCCRTTLWRQKLCSHAADFHSISEDKFY